MLKEVVLIPRFDRGQVSERDIQIRGPYVLVKCDSGFVVIFGDSVEDFEKDQTPTCATRLSKRENAYFLHFPDAQRLLPKVLGIGNGRLMSPSTGVIYSNAYRISHSKRDGVDVFDVTGMFDRNGTWQRTFYPEHLPNSDTLSRYVTSEGPLTADKLRRSNPIYVSII